MLATRRSGSARRPGGSSGRGRAAARFEVLDRVGEGTLWVTYRVRLRGDTTLSSERLEPNRVLALKALRSTVNRVPRLRAALESSANRWQALRIEGLAAIYEVGIEEETLYVLSEFVPGASLESRVARGALKADEVRQILRELALPLTALHAQEVAHGDIRARQVRFDERGHAILTDGGFAEAFSRAGMALADVQPEVAQYLAPERTQGAPISPASDVYALGALLYKMLTGRVPFDGPSALAIASRHRNDLVLAPSQLNPRVPGDLDALTLQLLEKAPEARPTAEDVLHLLRGETRRTRNAPDVQSAPVITRETTDGTNSKATSAIAASAAAMATSAATGATASATTAVVAPVAATTAVAPTSAMAPVVASSADAPMDVRIPKRRPLDEVVQETVAEEARQRREVDVKKAKRKHHWREFWGMLGAIFMFCLMVGAGIAGAYGAYNYWLNDIPQEVTVPPYLNKDFETAKQTLAKKGLGIKIVRESFDPKKPAGTVIAGEPEPGRTVRARRVVLVTVSAGRAPIRMVDFARLTLAQSRAIISRHGMRLGPVVEQYHPSVPRGLICGQFPEPGEPLRRSEPITLIVSRGPQPKQLDATLGALPEENVPDAPGAEASTPNLPPEDFAPLQPIRETINDEGLVDRTARISVTLPEGGNNQMVRVIVRDTRGERTAYQKMHPPGVTVTRSVRVVRAPSEVGLVRVYVGDTLVREEEL